MGKNLDKVYGSLQRMSAMIFDSVYPMAKPSFDTLSTNSSIFSSYFYFLTTKTPTIGILPLFQICQ